MKFRIEWPTGHMDLNIAEFFGKADKRRIGKVFRLARQHCVDSQRLSLADALKDECAARTEVLDAIGELDYRRRQMLRPFFGDVLPQLGNYEKQLVKQREKMQWCIDALLKERWS